MNEQTSRHYRSLSIQDHANGPYRIIPIRDEDRLRIMDWRNEQMGVLRQQKPLTKEDQDNYFRTVVASLFTEEKPSQILFSFLRDQKLIGYGGLVHIDWTSRNAEVSFLTETSRSRDPKMFVEDWNAYLRVLKGLIRENKLLKKIYTYAFDMRPILYEALRQSYFIQEARLRNHVFRNGVYHDVLIHSYFFEELSFRTVEAGDLMMYFEWANDPIVRANAFNPEPIPLPEHTNWFTTRINSNDSLMLVVMKEGAAVGQIRFDKKSEGVYEISYSIDRNHRGRRIGSALLSGGTEHFLSMRPEAHRVFGKVKADNLASVRSFEKAGFQAQSQTIGTDVLEFAFENPLL